MVFVASTQQRYTPQTTCRPHPCKTRRQRAVQAAGTIYTSNQIKMNRNKVNNDDKDGPGNYVGRHLNIASKLLSQTKIANLHLTCTRNKQITYKQSIRKYAVESTRGPGLRSRCTIQLSWRNSTLQTLIKWLMAPRWNILPL